MTGPISNPDRIVGGYRLGRKLGEGGQGQVYLASPVEGGGADVALKLQLLDFDAKGQQRTRTRQQREVRALQSVSAKSVTRLIAHGEHVEPSITHAGCIWTAFEFVDGRDLKHAIENWQAPSIARLLRTFASLSAGIDSVHSKDVVHRDIKPANVILRRKDWADPVLVDFGLVRETVASTLTRHGGNVGTEAYTAPEVLSNPKSASRMSDQWSFVRLSAEFLLWTTGVQHDDIPNGRQAAEEVVERLEAWEATSRVFEQGLDPFPDGRFADVKSFVNSLEEALFADGLLEREVEVVRFDGEPWDKRRPLQGYVEGLGFETKDTRPSGGALWVIAGREDFENVREYLLTKGVTFLFASAGGRATRHQPAWYSKDAP